MTLSDQAEQFVTLFRALADPNRLKIVGLLAHHPQSVGELAANLGVSSGTVSHHLQRLQKAGLVQAHVQSYYNVYSLRADVLRQMAEQLLTPDAVKATTLAMDLDAYSTHMLSEYWVRDVSRAFRASDESVNSSCAGWHGNSRAAGAIPKNA